MKKYHSVPEIEVGFMLEKDGALRASEIEAVHVCMQGIRPISKSKLYC